MWYNRHCNLYAISRQDAKERKKTVGNYENELEQFIYEVCYHPMWEEAAQYISAHPYALDLSRSRIKYPTSAYLENLSLEFTCNIRIAEDILSFDAVTNCSIVWCPSCGLHSKLIPYSIRTIPNATTRREASFEEKL